MVESLCEVFKRCIDVHAWLRGGDRHAVVTTTANLDWEVGRGLSHRGQVSLSLRQ